jgi:uroporphyrinogen decarboxylase
MTKVERVRAALAGRGVDRPPFSVWYHFGLQHAPAERTAQAHQEFFEAYDLDWLKVMNDYSYPMPPGLETLDRAEDLARVQPLDPVATPMAAQLEVIERLAGALAGRALVVDTLFNAWNTLRRNVVKDAMGPFMRDHPEALERALGAVTQSLIRYARASLARGAAGMFVSVPASAEFVTRDEYERFMRPFDLALLQALAGAGELHVLHAHGSRLYFDRLLDYPVHALSWADREGGPSLAEARRRTDRALMGGIGQAGFAYSSAAAVRAEVRAAVAMAGRERLFLAPGCAIASYAFPELIHAARDEAARV